MILKKLKGRSLAELQFRLRQEWMNATGALRPPSLPATAMSMAPLLPEPDAELLEVIRRSEVGDEILQTAEAALAGRFRLLGYQVQLPPSALPWRSDHVHDKPTPLRYFRRIPYLDFDQVGDHKVTWELNRHQHLIALAQAWRLTGQERFLSGIVQQLSSWWQDNPFHQGINWTSALEVAFRALSWIWVDHLAGRDLPPDCRAKLLNSLYQHAFHLEYNLSRYFAPNTHLQGEAVALHAIGILYPDMPRSPERAALGRAVLDQELGKQVNADGGHFEHSSYYHVYATDFFVFHYLLAGRPAHFLPVLEKMADYLHSLLGPDRRLAFTGDDDGGRLFHPYGSHDQYGRATLATCACLFQRSGWLASRRDLLPQAAWWLGKAACNLTAGYAAPVSRLFPQSGIAILSRDNAWVEVDVGPFGAFSGGHSHADTLSLVVRVNNLDILIDPGTYTYMADPVWRNRFRGAAAHNTIRVDGAEHVPPAGPFSWAARPEVNILDFAAGGRVSAEWTHGGVRHTRMVELGKSELRILDTVELPPGQHCVEQFWHPGLPTASASATVYRIGSLVEIAFLTPGANVSCELGGEFGWRSSAYGRKEEAPVIRVSVTGSQRVQYETHLRWTA